MSTDREGRAWNVLFLCTGNSARSVLAEAALARLGPPCYRAFSAGSEPKPAPHPVTIETLEELGYETAGLRSKSWDEFAGPSAPPLDLIFTVCGNAAEEVCPVWPGHPMTIHWGVEDPAAAEGSEEEVRVLFRAIHDQLLAKVEALVKLDPGAMNPDTLRLRLEEIGR